MKQYKEISKIFSQTKYEVRTAQEWMAYSDKVFKMVNNCVNLQQLDCCAKFVYSFYCFAREIWNGMKKQIYSENTIKQWICT